MHNKKPTLLVLAAGMGSRYGGLKQIDGIGPNNETIMEYSIYDAINVGFEKVVFLIRKELEHSFKELFAKKLQDKIEVAYAYQETNIEIEGIKISDREKPWGTAHAILSAKDTIDTPFLVINADDFYGKKSFEIMKNFLSTKCSENNYAMLGFLLEKTLSENGQVSRGVCEIQNDQLVSIEEIQKIYKQEDLIKHSKDDKIELLNPKEYVSMNFWGLHPHIFKYLEIGFKKFIKENHKSIKSEYLIPVEIENLIKSNQIKVSVLKGESNWFGVTYKDDKEIAKKTVQNFIKKGEYPNSLW
ncbi:nucleotidyltransferase family protein [Ichthyobacterium seriolicida]|uniref:Nucleotidyltransferase n=1 Tax=Ichthyobacterium seriolicida TaxID=242600 RepID=A0A1J1EAV0_9FLAO|nr:sugar phosphate nucleotidyltransferase [Ichthyobacterium seriolicida]BAV95067.1 nucleotidyltransferase [Ichthyobacterium seriolicida]